ncbi:T9SS type A sorting domain-containing protein [Flavobacterium sp.]|uniref:T9SS type A sorting domain-containing protein n=1 Tax=Flavobacterium sp. TaxID=239 RepID=UPI00261B0A92|nr:T9SS type A sorting domain-containing protein [Flavobacterium sp.]MDD2984955.1 T9SS type A sorting domain-containing protein [Flavobacterium sp.]
MNYLIHAQVPQPNHFTPGGVMDTIFDKSGNQYTFNDILINTQSNAQSRVTLLSCSNNSIFNLYFEEGSGCEDNSIIEHNLRRQVICNVFEDLSAFLTTSSSALQPTSTTKVNIWVRNIANIPDISPQALGLASGFYNFPASATTGGITDNEIWKTIHNGIDSYTNVVNPLITAGSGSNSSGIFFHGYMAFNFDASINWNLDTSVFASTTEKDLYTVVLHEITHALGFNSLIDVDGSSKFSDDFNYFSRYDLFLKSDTNVPLLSTNSTINLYNNTFNSSLLSSTILHPNCTISGNVNTGSTINTTVCYNAVKYFGAVSTVPVYTPTCYESGSSLSHFEDELYPSCSTAYGNDSYFVMSNANGNGVTKRFLKPEERNALCDLGYAVNTTYGVSGTIINVVDTFYDYGGSICDGIMVAGINDGITFGANNSVNFTFLGNTSMFPNINIYNILQNDQNATGFEGLEDITGNATLSVTSGDASTVIEFNSTSVGLHLLRYVPTYGAQKGNITYIYVYVIPNNPEGLSTCVPLPNPCDLILNGDFEQNSSIPNNWGNLNLACGWWEDGIAGPDYFHIDSPIQIGSPSIPCNGAGNQNPTNLASKGHAGFYALKHINSSELNVYETITSKLSFPLEPNTAYQLSFNISLSEMTSANPIKVQAFLSSDYIPRAYPNNHDISNGIFLENATFTINSVDNQWDTVVFNFTTTSGGEQYLYLGGINNVQFSTNTIISSPSNGCSFIEQNEIIDNYIHSYNFIDNISLIPTNGATFILPESITCTSSIIEDLHAFLDVTPLDGYFSGLGVSNSISTPGTYSFNPALAGVGTIAITYHYQNSSGCPIELIRNILVTGAEIIPLFSSIDPICIGAAYTLPSESNNGFAGTWSPDFNSQSTTTYTFTPNANSCAIPTTLTVEVTNTNALTPIFTSLAPVCAGATFTLPTVSNNSFTGTWSPEINIDLSTQYIFTPDNGQCATLAQMNVEIINPEININGRLNVCTGQNPSYYSNILGGLWSSSDISIATITPETGKLTTVNTGTVTLSYTLSDSCSSSSSIIVNIIDRYVIPEFSFLTTICKGSIPPRLPGISDNNLNGVWIPAIINNVETGDYTFFADGNCIEPITITVTVITSGELMANEDYFYLPYMPEPHLSPSILNNDLFNGEPITSNFLGLTISLIGFTHNITVNNDGTLNLPPDLPPGLYSFDYILENRCLHSENKRITLNIFDGALNAKVKFLVDVCYKPDAYITEQSFLSGVAYGEIRATSENVTFSNIIAPAGFSINPDGTVNVPANALPGDYIFTYTLCPTGSTTGCVYDIIVSFTIYNTVRAVTDVFNFDTSGTFLGSNHDDPTSFNILTNDGYAADCGFSAPNSFVGAVLNNNVTISTINQTELAGNFNILNNGTVIPLNNNIPTGYYNFTYEICDYIFPNACSTTYGWINVMSTAKSASTNIKEKLDDNLVSIYPNPSKDIFTVSFQNTIDKGNIKVFSALGQVLFSNSIQQTNEEIIDLSRFSNGTYLIQIILIDNVVNKRIIKN